MQILKIQRSKSSGSGVKIHGTILGDKGISYRFGYIRRKNFRGWLCGCDSFLLRMFSKHRNCKHLHEIRAQFGRYGQLVPKYVRTHTSLGLKEAKDYVEQVDSDAHPFD